MQEVVFADPSNGDMQLMNEMNSGDSSLTILSKQRYPRDEDKAAYLVRTAPAATTVNGTLMTALKNDNVRGVMALYRTRQRRKPGYVAKLTSVSRYHTHS